MDFLFIIVLFVIFSIIDSLTSRKKRRLPPQNPNGQPNFDIPTLANDPNLPGEEIPMVVEIPRPAEIRPREMPPLPQKNSAQVVREEKNFPEVDVEFTPSTIVNGFILSELLDKPKALRRGRR